MPLSSDLRSRKRLATRRAISLVANRLFRERGFENVTVDEIAAAAEVGRMTVFNYFPRKEDMFFDRDEEGREVLREALRQRDPHIAPIETLRLLVHRLVSERAPYLDFSAASQDFIETVNRSETLMARARAIRDKLARVLTEALLASGENLPIPMLIWRLVCCWQRGPWPPFRLTRLFEGVEMRRNPKQLFSRLWIREQSV